MKAITELPGERLNWARGVASSLGNAPWVGVDLDSTICDTRHRQHLIEDRTRENWKQYSMACSDDPVAPGMVALVKTLADYYNIAFVSGRDECALDLTVEWFKRQEIPWDAIRLRPEDAPKMKNAALKASYVRDCRALRGWFFQLWVDDLHLVAPAMEELGVPTLLVLQPGGENAKTGV